MLRYKRWIFEAWYQSECTNILSLAPWVTRHPQKLEYPVRSIFRSKGLVFIMWAWVQLLSLCMLVFHFIIQTYNLHTPHKHGYWNLRLVLCKQIYEMHIKMQHTSLWAWSPYLCAFFYWSPYNVISFVCLHGISSIFIISMLVWCMLVVDLNDEMQTSMHRISSDFTSKYF